METCASCKNWMQISPGHAGICRVKQRGRIWNEGIAITIEDDTCKDFQYRNVARDMPMFAAT